MKNFNQFKNESRDDDFNKHRLEQRKIVKPFFQKIVNDFDGKMDIRRIRPWKDDTDILLRVEGKYYYDRHVNIDSLIKSCNDLIDVCNKIKKYLDIYNFKYDVKIINMSYDIEISIILSNSYFDDNKDLLSSLKGLNKFNL